MTAASWLRLPYAPLLDWREDQSMSGSQPLLENCSARCRGFKRSTGLLQPGPHLSSPCCDTSDEKVLWFKRIIVTNKWKSKRVYGGLHEKCEFTQTWILCSFFEKTKLKKHDYLLVGLGWCELLQTGLIFSQLYHILPLGVAFCSSAIDLWT